jgi:DNA-binding LytR/AlgR family response regulator
MHPQHGPQRIVCLTEETTEWLYLLGEQHRIVGISGYTVRPRQARQEKPRVSAFLDGKIDKIVALEPDLVFLDIAMPGLTGLDVANALEGRSQTPAIVFVTAFDQFAVAAFDAAAIDYLLKPVAPERLEKAVGRVRERRRADPHLPARRHVEQARGLARKLVARLQIRIRLELGLELILGR